MLTVTERRLLVTTGQPCDLAGWHVASAAGDQTVFARDPPFNYDGQQDYPCCADPLDTRSKAIYDSIVSLRRQTIGGPAAA